MLIVFCRSGMAWHSKVIGKPDEKAVWSRLYSEPDDGTTDDTETGEGTETSAGSKGTTLSPEEIKKLSPQGMIGKLVVTLCGNKI